MSASTASTVLILRKEVPAHEFNDIHVEWDRTNKYRREFHCPIHHRCRHNGDVNINQYLPQSQLTTLEDPDLLTAKMSVTYSCVVCKHVFVNTITGLMATWTLSVARRHGKPSSVTVIITTTTICHYHHSHHNHHLSHFSSQPPPYVTIIIKTTICHYHHHNHHHLSLLSSQPPPSFKSSCSCQIGREGYVVHVHTSHWKRRHAVFWNVACHPAADVAAECAICCSRYYVRFWVRGNWGG